uniref:Cyclic nucleotide-binding domain-containing protein n=1 Tax=Callorhinchus milii TaxID=7868 RepID=A0A4W3HW42_CALMI
MCRICMRFRVGSSYFMENLKTDTGYEGESDEEDKEEESAISFDVNYFKPNKNRLAYKMVKIAKKHPEWRTREELESLCSVLRSLISIRHCSKPYQLVLAKVMRYERYRRRRIVLKRGHYPQCCYFVFSGGISFTLDVDGSSAFENEQSPHLQKGGRFGVSTFN